VEGNLHGIERVEPKKSAILTDPIYKHPVAIEDGQYLNGGVLVQMEIPTLQTASVDEGTASW
jgi:hypothetical protein